MEGVINFVANNLGHVHDMACSKSVCVFFQLSILFAGHQQSGSHESAYLLIALLH